MLRSKESLAGVLSQRLGCSGPRTQHCLDEASEVIVFGSMAAGLDRPDSDIDVLCIGGRGYKLKSSLLDLIVVPLEGTKSRAWLQGELATHVGKYGTWIRGTPQWKGDVRVGPGVVSEKRRRISAFFSSLENSWFKLEECFHVKYSVKLRRETQRLILLERGVPVPPTRILDCSWTSMSSSPNEVYDRLREFAPNGHGSFINDLLARVDAHFRASSVPT